MSAELRAQWMERLPAEVLEMTTLPSIKREYTLSEIAMMSRMGPARLYGFADRGRLDAGAVADIAVYKQQNDKAGMFRSAALVFKDGVRVVRDGVVTRYTQGKTLLVRPDYDRAIEGRLDAYYDELYGLPRNLFDVPATALGGRSDFAEVACRI
jgi:formylmethanofuran dehydrogenase subunit A